MTLKDYEQQTRVRQVAEIKQEASGRTTADARTTSHSPSSSPSNKPTGKPVEKFIAITSADQLQVGMRLRVRDQGLSGLVEVVKVYPANFRSLDETEASAYVEGVNSHSWSGLYFDEHLKQYKAVIVQG